jgi:murein DD-endopeptidase MepM/ murein hydrolase activator NlpD
VTETYVVQNGDTLGGIALEYNTTIENIAHLNGLADLASISIGQSLQVPVEDLSQLTPATKLAPDSELVYGPSTIGFNTTAFVAQTNGYLRSYTEEVDGEILSGAEIVQRIAERYSVGPRVLLTLIEYRGGWLSNPSPASFELFYPAGHADERFSGLHKQLMWAADHLNAAYYGWKERGKQTILLNDFTRARIAPGLNAGTIALQSLLAFDSTADEWRSDTSPAGFFATYLRWFGDPFARASEPLIPAGLTQPPLTLPWPVGQTWYYTGGPHGGWGSGSAWAAIDFVDPDNLLGCYSTDQWVTSMSEGVVVRSRTGEVIIDLDGDGYEQTGWTILYLHIEARDRVEVGVRVRAGDGIGHPSCEGGFSSGTHMHLARRYNGEWIAAGGALPFVIEGWTTVGDAEEYSGWLEKNGERKEACECRDDAVNGITH